MIDIIIISASKNTELIKITQNAVDTCYNSKGKFNIFVIETFKKHEYKNAKIILFKQKDFNYNKTINFALSKTNNKHVGVFNNDVVFEKNWYIELVKGFEKYDSLSPRCEYSNNQTFGFVPGYRLRKNINGWAICFKRSIIKKIGGFNEDVHFWRSDDIYREQIKVARIKHALVSSSIVNHLGSLTLKTLNQKEREDKTYNQYRIFKDLELYNYQFTIVMPSYLGEYQNAAKNRDKKLKRAIESVRDQSFKDWELIIVSDGCDKTVDIAKKYLSENIKCFKIQKQPYMSGNVRDIGIENATGKYIIYLDSDDMYGKDHLKKVYSKINGYDWVYFNDIMYNGPKENSIKNVYLSYGVAGTSSICHKRLLNEGWNKCDGYGHDWTFIEKLMKHQNYSHIGNSEYRICHVPGEFDYNGNN
jgi:GT2 family glycosyltransferase